jgi:tetratricopeptide (TPR) repeat protein
MALVSLKRFEEALEAFNSAIALDDTKADLWAQKALALYNLNKIDEASAAIEKALSFDQDWKYALDLKELIDNPEESAETPSLDEDEGDNTDENVDNSTETSN